MYYVVCFSIYFIFLLSVVLYLKKPKNKHKTRFKRVFQREMMKGVFKTDIKSRKKRVKILPLWQRFLFWLWFLSMSTMIFLLPIVFCILRYYLIDWLFISDDAIYYKSVDGASLVFGVGGFIFGIPILVGYSYLTNRGMIRKADSLYRFGSFQEYPKAANVFISIALLLISLPIMIISFNSYTFCSQDSFTHKPVFSIVESVYSYNDVEYIEEKVYTGGKKDYIAHMKNSKKITLCETVRGVEDMLIVFNEYKLETKINVVKP